MSVEWSINDFEVMKIMAPRKKDGVNDKVKWKCDDNRLVPFNTKLVMDVLSLNTVKAKWHELIWFKQCIPKHSFCLWLAMLERLLTHNKIMSWGIQTGLLYPLCNKHERNQRIFRGEKRDADILHEAISEVIKLKLMNMKVKESNAVKKVAELWEIQFKNSNGIRAQGIKQHSNSRFNHHSRKSALDKKQRMKKLIDGMEQFGQDFLFRSFRRVHDPGNKDKDVYMVLEIRMKDICNIILDIRIQQIEMKTANNKLHTMEQIQEEKTRRRNKKIGRTQRLNRLGGNIRVQPNLPVSFIFLHDPMILFMMLFDHKSILEIIKDLWKSAYQVSYQLGIAPHPWKCSHKDMVFMGESKVNCYEIDDLLLPGVLVLASEE
ncbi:RNA-directed DNA polymerase, eukaryota, reverse transcriptase zinc-binding domain protein [Tanacetum coccineum]